MRNVITLFAIFLLPALVRAQQTPAKYPWQAYGTHCTKYLTFCWYGAEDVSDPEVTAHGNIWTTTDNSEKPNEWVTEVRCIHQKRICILARNEKGLFSGSMTNIDIYTVQEWTDTEIRAVGESDLPPGHECEIDTLMLHRTDASVTMLSEPGPAAADKSCTLFIKPKTVLFTLVLGLAGAQDKK
jgi:hypothetical protein